MTPVLILTRPKGQNAPFAERISTRWAKPLMVIQSPLLEIEILQASAPEADGVILTSTNGVAAAQAMGLGDGRQAWCVGDRTTAAAQAAGFAAINGPGTADALVAQIIAAHPRGRLAHIRGTHARGDIARQLAAAGLPCLDVVAYDQKPLQLGSKAKEVLAGRQPVVLPLFSPRTASILCDQGPFAAPLHLVAMSAAVRDAITLKGKVSVHIATDPDAQAMAKAVIDVLGRLAAH